MATTDTDFQHIALRRNGHVAVITLDRADCLNALNRLMAQELHDVLDRLAAEFPDTRAIVITGAGRGFCSGAHVGDIAKRMADPKDGVFGQSSGANSGPSITMRLAPHLREVPQPVIAAVNRVAAWASPSPATSG